jgi:hypothetical protein
MNKLIKSKLGILLTGMTAMLWMAACSDMNELGDRFLNREEVFYAEKVDSAATHTGIKQIEIEIYVKSTRIDFVRAYWNNSADSTDIPVSFKSGIFRKTVENMKASEYIFNLVSFDKYGNRSLPYELVGKVASDD